MDLFNFVMVCDLVGRAPAAVYRHIKSGRLPERRVRIGNRLFWTAEDVATIKAFFAEVDEWNAAQEKRRPR